MLRKGNSSRSKQLIFFNHRVGCTNLCGKYLRIACSSGNCYAHIYITRMILSWELRGLCCCAVVCKKSLIF